LGDDERAFPLPRVGGRPILPILSADWLPDGGVASLELVVGAAPGTYRSFLLRHGDGPAGSFGAAGAAADRMFELSRFVVGGEVEVWTRPGGSVGAGARARFTLTRGSLENAFFDVGLKSAGHWPGRPLAPGAFFRVGYRWID
jgi:hypothetical protein